MPQHRTLVERLSKFFSLGDIMANPRRKVKLVDLNDPTSKGDDLRYRRPAGRKALDEELLVDGYPDGGARMVVFEAPARFQEDRTSPYRDGGILVKSGHAIQIGRAHV